MNLEPMKQWIIFCFNLTLQVFCWIVVLKFMKGIMHPTYNVFCCVFDIGQFKLKSLGLLSRYWDWTKIGICISISNLIYSFMSKLQWLFKLTVEQVSHEWVIKSSCLTWVYWFIFALIHLPYFKNIYIYIHGMVRFMLYSPICKTHPCFLY